MFYPLCICLFFKDPTGPSFAKAFFVDGNENFGVVSCCTCPFFGLISALLADVLHTGCLLMDLTPIHAFSFCF